MCYCHYYYILSQTNYKINSPAYKTNNPKKKTAKLCQNRTCQNFDLQKPWATQPWAATWEPPMGPKKLANEKAASEMPCIMPWLFRGESGNRGSWRKVAKKNSLQDLLIIYLILLGWMWKNTSIFFLLGTFAFISTAFNHILTETFLWQSGVVRQRVKLDKGNMIYRSSGNLMMYPPWK